MSKETLEYLNANTLVGFTAKRGQAWHYREEMQGDEPNHYTGAIPVEDVRRRLFGWEPVEAMSAAIVMTDEGVQTIVDETRKQIVHPNTGRVGRVQVRLSGARLRRMARAQRGNHLA